MSNDYKEEFDVVCTVGVFWEWLRANNNHFYYNMILMKPSEVRSIREWMEMFLLWSEYEDNKKNGNQT